MVNNFYKIYTTSQHLSSIGQKYLAVSWRNIIKVIICIYDCYKNLIVLALAITKTWKLNKKWPSSKSQFPYITKVIPDQNLDVACKYQLVYM